MSGRASGTSRKAGARSCRERERVRALGDAALVAAMREGDPWALGEFMARFTSPLESYARASRIPRSDWNVCVVGVLEAEALRLARPDQPVPQQLTSHLVRAVRNRGLRLKRSLLCRERDFLLVAEPLPSKPTAFQSLAAAVRRDVTREEELILGWIAHGVPHRQIAEWLGVSYEAATKRIWRLCRRLRARAAEHAEALAPEERGEAVRRVRRTHGSGGAADECVASPGRSGRERVAPNVEGDVP